MISRFFYLLSAAFLLLFACKKQSDPIIQPEDNAGKGGSGSLKVAVSHHSKPISNAIVFIKYNTSEQPLSFDDSVACVWENGKAIANFSSLKKGQYYLLGKGYDTTIFQNVIGGIPYKLAEETAIAITLPVTEDH